MASDSKAEAQARVDALLSDSLRESHQEFIAQVWRLQAELIANGRGFSSDMNYAIRRAGENEVSKRAALIEDTWRRVLVSLGGAVAEIDQEFLDQDAEARLRSSSAEVELMVRAAITHRDSDPHAPTGIEEKVAVSLKALKTSLSLLLAETMRQDFSGQIPTSIEESHDKVMQFWKAALLIVEICAVGVALVFGAMWVQQPQGPYEPYTFLALLLGGTIVELIRRYLPSHAIAKKRQRPFSKKVQGQQTARSPTALGEGNTAGTIAKVQEGSVNLDTRGEREIRIVYPEAFCVRPNLDVRVESGVGNKVNITEEDETGFTVVKPGFWASGNSHTLIHWRATGRAR